MENLTSQKIQPWTRKDAVLNVVVYVLNFILLGLMFLGAIYLGSQNETTFSIAQFFANPKSVISFFVLLALAIMFMALYFIFEESDFVKSASNTEMLFLIIEVSLLVIFVCGNFINPFIRPLALAAILTLFLTNTKTAVFVNIVTSIIIFLFDAYGGSFISGERTEQIYFMFLGISSGIISVYVLNNVYSRLKIILMSFLVSIPTVLYILLPFVAGGNPTTILTSVLYGAVSGPMSVVALMILLPIFEGIFRKVSCFKYSELTDHKAKLVRKMIIEAPGTFNHSIIVSNVAEACATAIGEDALFARTCAYYHDIGKLRRPEFFKENQGEGFNPHDDITPELSANIIKSHGVDGYKLIKKNRLPLKIADVCLQHHGTMPIIYFYDKAKKYTDGEVDILQYCYPGPKPQNKISAIIMIADASEAASRTLKDRSRESVGNVVKKCIKDRMQLGQFEECEITLKELNIIENTVINTLTGVYHDRIKYPKMNIKDIEGQLEEEL